MGTPFEQVDEVKYLGLPGVELMHCTKGLSPAIEYLCKAAKRAMFGVQRRCQELKIHNPVLKCTLFDTLVKPILCYSCEVWSVLGTKTALESMDRIQLRFLKTLLDVRVHTKTLQALGRVRMISSAWYMAVASRQSLAAAGVPLFRQDTCTSLHHVLEASQEAILAVQTGHSASSVSCGNTIRGAP